MPKLSPRLNLQGERGSASLIAAALVAALTAITMGGAQVGATVIARHRAQAAADLGALAGAAYVPTGTRAACARAAGVARAMGAIVVTCTVDRLDVVVAVEAPTPLGLSRMGPARAAARAGPADARVQYLANR